MEISQDPVLDPPLGDWMDWWIPEEEQKLVREALEFRMQYTGWCALVCVATLRLHKPAMLNRPAEWLADQAPEALYWTQDAITWRLERCYDMLRVGNTTHAAEMREEVEGVIKLLFDAITEGHKWTGAIELDVRRRIQDWIVSDIPPLIEKADKLGEAVVILYPIEETNFLKLAALRHTVKPWWCDFTLQE